MHLEIVLNEQGLVALTEQTIAIGLPSTLKSLANQT